ncbi:hypothetical protein [Brevibacterium picturae]|uniref:hypothetical protein n=1 Tax=Brevibacterium picturae TaxID=260553 RepID=UPI0031F81E83
MKPPNESLNGDQLDLFGSEVCIRGRPAIDQVQRDRYAASLHFDILPVAMKNVSVFLHQLHSMEKHELRRDGCIGGTNTADLYQRDIVIRDETRGQILDVGEHSDIGI